MRLPEREAQTGAQCESRRARRLAPAIRHTNGSFLAVSTALAGSTLGARKKPTRSGRACGSPVRGQSGEPRGCVIRTARRPCLPAKPQPLSSEHGKDLYRRRQGMIEPVFANTKFNRKIYRFHRRGRSAVRSEWRLITATHTSSASTSTDSRSTRPDPAANPAASRNPGCRENRQAVQRYQGRNLCPTATALSSHLGSVAPCPKKRSRTSARCDHKQRGSICATALGPSD
jgi:Transposase DDE domain